MNECSTAKILSKPFGSLSTFEYGSKFLDHEDIHSMALVCKAWRRSVIALHHKISQVKPQQIAIDPDLAKDNLHRQKAESYLDQARILKLPNFNKVMHLQESEQIKLSRAEYRKAMTEILLIDSANRTEEDLKSFYTAAGHIAARDKMRSPCCLLCLEDKKLIGSHVIPKSVLLRLTNDVSPSGKIGKNLTSIGSTTNPNANRSAESMKWPLFCKPGCEDLFSDHGEDGFADPFWKFIIKTREARNHTPTLSSRYESKPGDNSVHYCIASIVFRYMIINGNNDIKPFKKGFGPELQEAYWRLFFLLRNYVLDPDNAPPPHIELFASDKDIGEKTMINTIFTTFTDGKKPRFTTGHFELAGFHFIVTESAEASHLDNENFGLPPKGFSCVIERCEAPNRVVIEILPHQVLALPNVANYARELDAKAWRKLNMSRSPKVKIIDGHEVYIMAAHPLADSTMKKFPPMHISRLPDGLQVVIDPANETPNLNFRDPSRHQVLTYTHFTTVEQTYDAWLIKDKFSKKDPHTIVIHVKNRNNSRKSFGYHLADRLFERDFSVEAQAILEHCREDNKKEVVEFLGLKPLRGTQHELIEEVTSAASSYHAIIHTLKEWWSPRHSKAQVPRNFIAHAGKNEVHFVEKVLPRGSLNGFHMLNTSREESISLLLENSKNEQIRALVANDIFDEMTLNELPPSLRIASALKAQKKYHELTRELWVLISLFESRGSSVSQEDAGRYKELLKERDDLTVTIRNWAAKEGVYRAFVKDFIGTQRKELACVPGQSGLLDAIAKLKHVYIDIWHQESENSPALTHFYAAGDPTNRNARRIDAILTEKFTHFNLLLEQ